MSPGDRARSVFLSMCDDHERERERKPPRLRTFRYGSDQPHLVLPDDSPDPSHRVDPDRRPD